MAREFDGSTDWLTNTAAPVSGPPCTLVAWVNVDVTTGTKRIVNLVDSFNPPNEILNLVGSGSAIVAEHYDGSTNGQSTSSAISANTWYHAAGVFASNSSRTVYLDGVAGTENTTTVTPPGTLSDVSIGALHWTSPGAIQFWNGELAEVAIWNVVLTAGEILALSKGWTPPQIRPGSLVGYWPLMGRHSPEPDLSPGTNYPMTLTGPPTQSPHPRVIYPVYPRHYPIPRKSSASVEDAIGPGWAAGAWVNASWAAGAWSPLATNVPLLIV